MACTEQTEDTPRGNKVNSPLKKSSTSEQAPQTLSLPRSDHAAERLICCCHHGKCKAQQQSITCCFITLPAPSISLPRLQIKEQTSGGCATVTMLKSRVGRGGQRSRAPGCPCREELLPAQGTKWGQGHRAVPCFGTWEPVMGQREQLQADTSGTGDTLGTVSGTAGAGRAWAGVGHEEGRCLCCHRHMDSSGRKSLTEPAQPKAEGTCCGSGTQGFNFFLSMQFFPPCKERLQQAKQIRGCNVISDICS